MIESETRREEHDILFREETGFENTNVEHNLSGKENGSERTLTREETKTKFFDSSHKSRTRIMI